MPVKELPFSHCFYHIHCGATRKLKMFAVCSLASSPNAVEEYVAETAALHDHANTHLHIQWALIDPDRLQMCPMGFAMIP